MILKEDIEEIRNIDLLTYFYNYYPDELIKIGHSGYRTKTHSSLHLSNGLWYYFARGIGGRSALDYLIYVEGYSFTDAYDHLKFCVRDGIPENIAYESHKCHYFVLPVRNKDNEGIRDYLVNKRYIDKDIVEYFINNDYIYESEDHCVVFIGYDEKHNAKHAFLRSILTDIKKDAYGSNKKYSFSYSHNSDVLHVFESAIDLLSYLTLSKYRNEDTNDDYLSLSGVSGKATPALDYYLYTHPHIRNIILHLDNDDAGRYATNKIIEKFGVIYCVSDYMSKYKDINDELICYVKSL